MNNTGFFGGRRTGGFIFIVLPLGFAHAVHDHGVRRLGPPVRGDALGRGLAAKGIWRSIFYSAIGGWILLLSFLFAVQSEAGVTKAGGGVATIFAQALTSKWGGTVLLIATIGQLFCTMACMTSCTRCSSPSVGTERSRGTKCGPD